MKKVFHLNTKNTSYIFGVLESGHLEQLYYGKRIKQAFDSAPLEEKRGTGLGTTIPYSPQFSNLNLDNLNQEISTAGKGDFRAPFIIIKGEKDSFINDFLFEKSEEIDNFSIPSLPNSLGKIKTTVITLKDKAAKLTLKLYYSLFDDCDAIARSCSLTNDSDQKVVIEKIASSQLDLPFDGLVMTTLSGAWVKERYIYDRPLSLGITQVDSKVGYSSNTHNPYVVLKKPDATLDCGDCWGFNLVYSGNHFESAEVTIHGKTRFLQGINPFGFEWELAAGETFFTPEATLCFSSCGTSGLTSQYHAFVNNHILRGKWAKKPRPVLINNWEATYFGFTEKKLLELAKSAKSLGIELFVLDDGWFGKRTDDTKGLGDWKVNTKKLPEGLKGLAEKINKIGLDFGIWVEPEMVNPDSDLYKAHPEWAVTHPNYPYSLGRNQLLLDLTNEKVQNYIIDSMTEVFSSANISYVKWDFNRPMSDFYSGALDNQGEFFHRYALGLYNVLTALTQRFPDILFESCASGGNRVDLGILCYMPQFWCSDNTDSADRVKIQEGTLTAYPPSTIGAHVSASPNHQTLRQSTIDNRFNTACQGLLGYELDLSKLTPSELKSVKAQIAFYKKWRNVLQYGQYIQLQSIFDKPFSSWMTLSPDKSGAVAGMYLDKAETSPPSDILKLRGLDEETKYSFKTRPQVFPAKQFGDLIQLALPRLAQTALFQKIVEDGFSLPCEKEEYTAYGDLLNNAGVKLYQSFSSSGWDETVRIMTDYGSRLYEIEKT